jgi:hypothetical protein
MARGEASTPIGFDAASIALRMASGTPTFFKLINACGDVSKFAGSRSMDKTTVCSESPDLIIATTSAFVIGARNS